MNLEIIVITYNRASYLKNTLDKIVNSRLVNCKITVFDNASSDETYSVCESFKRVIPSLNVVRHRHNIGLGGNIIRAIEFGTLAYTWVLCDDDILDFSNLDDLEEVLLNEQVDLIHAGGHPTKNWTFGGRYNKVKEFFCEGYPYFKHSSFLPANIFKTEKFQNNFLIAGYNNVVNAYPHMPYLLGLYEENAVMYISKARIITARMAGQSYSENSWYLWWIKTCELLNNKEDVRSAFFDQWKNLDDNTDKACLDSVYKFRSTQNLLKNNYLSIFIQTYFTKNDKMYLYRLKVKDFYENKFLNFLYNKKAGIAQRLRNFVKVF